MIGQLTSIKAILWCSDNDSPRDDQKKSLVSPYHKLTVKLNNQFRLRESILNVEESFRINLLILRLEKIYRVKVIHTSLYCTTDVAFFFFFMNEAKRCLLLRYSLYCSGLELNPHYLRGLPVFGKHYSPSFIIKTNILVVCLYKSVPAC